MPKSSSLSTKPTVELTRTASVSNVYSSMAKGVAAASRIAGEGRARRRCIALSFIFEGLMDDGCKKSDERIKVQ